jgi:transposase
MKSYTKTVAEGERLFVGVDQDKKRWQVTIRTQDCELQTANIEAGWPSLEKFLSPYHGHPIEIVYEAGYFGYSLYDAATAWGARCIVTPPSMLPQQQGNRVKTDKRDSRKLALFLAKGLLSEIYVPTPDERNHRLVARRRRQLISDRVAVQARIKALLRFYGIELMEKHWSKTYLENLQRLRLDKGYAQESFQSMLRQYQFLCQEVNKQTALLRALSQEELYQERVKILCSIPGLGLITAMEILLELQDVARFRRAEALAAYVGLTPSQHSSGEHVRMGRITRIGKHSLRAMLVEAAWQLIRKDQHMHSKYENIKQRAGGKRAIVAIARKLLLCARRMLLDGQQYRVAA